MRSVRIMDNSSEAPSVKQQLIEMLRGAESIVVTTKKNPGRDEIAGAIGLHLLLDKLEKVAEVVIAQPIPKQLQFLPSDMVNSQLQGQRDFVVEIDQSRTEADHLKYVVEDNKLKIYITPYNGSFSEKDASFSYGEYHCDAIVGLGVQNLEEIDEGIRSEEKLTQNARFLLLNPGEGNPVDANTVNWSDPNASSVCEMIMSMSEALGSGLLDDTIATTLLTGIIDRTQHFTNQATTPKVMTMSAQLLAAGARQGEIIQQLSQPDPQPEASSAEPMPAKEDEASDSGDKSDETSGQSADQGAEERPPNEFQIRKSKTSSEDKEDSSPKQESRSVNVRDMHHSQEQGSDGRDQTKEEKPAQSSGDSPSAKTSQSGSQSEVSSEQPVQPTSSPGQAKGGGASPQAAAQPAAPSANAAPTAPDAAKSGETPAVSQAPQAPADQGGAQSPQASQSAASANQQPQPTTPAQQPSASGTSQNAASPSGSSGRAASGGTTAQSPPSSPQPQPTTPGQQPPVAQSQAQQPQAQPQSQSQQTPPQQAGKQPPAPAGKAQPQPEAQPSGGQATDGGSGASAAPSSPQASAQGDGTDEKGHEKVVQPPEGSTDNSAREALMAALDADSNQQDGSGQQSAPTSAQSPQQQQAPSSQGQNAPQQSAQTNQPADVDSARRAVEQALQDSDGQQGSSS